MGLNIVATRKYSLKGFAEGWDDAFIIIRSANEEQRRTYARELMEMRQPLNDAVAAQDEALVTKLSVELDETADQKVRDFVLGIIQGGKVVSTTEDGSTELVSFGKDDASVVLEALGFAWVNELAEVAIGGNERLKARN